MSTKALMGRLDRIERAKRAVELRRVIDEYGRDPSDWPHERYDVIRPSCDPFVTVKIGPTGPAIVRYGEDNKYVNLVAQCPHWTAILPDEVELEELLSPEQRIEVDRAGLVHILWFPNDWPKPRVRGLLSLAEEFPEWRGRR